MNYSLLFNSFNRIALIFSDPGGAKSILALSEYFLGEGREVMVITDRSYSFVKDFSVATTPFAGEPKEVLKSFKADAIFTGTSYSSSIELEFVQASKDLGIYSYSFIDHWTSFRSRFTKGTDEIFPNKVLVIDDRALQLAIREGLEPEKLQVIGNPFHQWLKSWKPSIGKNEYFTGIGVSMAKPLIVFAPEPLSNVNGKEKFGFDELEIIENLKEWVGAECLEKFTWVLKPHPNQNLEELLKLLPSEIKLLSKDADSLMLIYYAEMVVGFFSNFLVEAQVLNKQVIRLIPTSAVLDPLIDMGIGISVNEHLIKSVLNGI